MNDLIRGYRQYLCAGGRSGHTVHARQNLLRRLDAELPCGLNAYSTEDLEKWLSPYTGWTLYTYHTAICDFSRWAAARGYHEWDPATALARPRQPNDEPHPASDEDIDHALTHLHGVAKTAVIVATYSGLRCAEICRLQRRHVTAASLWVQRKGAKTQLLPTHPFIWKRLRDHPDGLILRTRDGQPFRPAYLSHLVSRHLTRIGLSDLTLHRFRSSFATRLAEVGVHASVIQELMGHQSLTTTQRYVKVTDGQRRDAITALPAPAASIYEAA